MNWVSREDLGGKPRSARGRILYLGRGLVQKHEAESLVIAMACLAAGFSSVCFAQDHATDDKLTREEWQSRVNAARERLKQRREELRLEREKQVGPKREELRLDREERLGPKQEELSFDRENRLGPKQEELKLDREKRIEPKRDELRRERDEQREQKVLPPSPTQAR